MRKRTGTVRKRVCTEHGGGRRRRAEVETSRVVFENIFEYGFTLRYVSFERANHLDSPFSPFIYRRTVK